MAPLSAILFVVFTFEYSFGYRLDSGSEMTWPEEYHITAETINLFTGIAEPSEMWFSKKLSKSRMDLYEGTVKKYYYVKPWPERGHVYMVHPITNQAGDVEIQCEPRMTRMKKLADFLPSLEGFTSENGELNGVEVKILTKTEETMAIREETVIYVYETLDDDNIPLQIIEKKFNKINGALENHVITNILNYDFNVTEEVFDVEDHNCVTAKSSNNFHEEIDYLHPAIPIDVDLGFDGYKKYYNRKYEEEEHEIRREIFRKNWKLIRDHNKKNLSYKMALNKFADQTDEELAYLNGARPSYPLMQGTHPFPHTEAELEEMAETFPEEYDMRTEGLVSRIKNQAHCGSCWAFAATAAIEAALSRVNGGRNFDLSEQSLIDCAWPYQVHGCDGGFMDRAFEYVLHNGMPTEREYGPYLQQDGYCHIKNMTTTYTIKGYTAVTSVSPNAMKAALIHHGPVAVGVFASGGLKFYRSGVFYDVDCPKGIMNHGVVVVGYGHRDGDLYWIVKNSYGADWGEDGYVLMAAADNNCNIMSVPFYPVA